ncbi:hypothetical protein [Clostridium botulinum]|nr:hypothetical protein [Clostridium botulinum]AUN06635.1 hypothetical protein RSJ14_07915 [Clostridium botulinum]MBN3352732.1 hypothetical protein [Clostridium botulinum]MBN3360560.1 hypothetical protein [Clostridium botulinum]MBN3365636.1 hypothetical protein [Clostridium botulinum]MBN3385885.1 hypothetical protein [Clostridium botulinum]
MKLEINGQELTHWETGKLIKRLPGMNDIVKESKKGRGCYQPYSKMKQYYQTIIYSKAVKLPGFNKVNITIDWYEPNAKRDIDNITAGSKFILDALVKASIIQDDSQKFVKALYHNIHIDKKNPRIEVTLKEVG